MDCTYANRKTSVVEIMPVTSFNIPENLLAFVDEVVASGVVRNRTEVFISAIENYAKFQMHRWKTPLIYFHGTRAALVSRSSVLRAVDGMSDKELRAAGRRMGLTVKESLLTEYRLTSSRPENRKRILSILRESGWGVFRLLENNRILVRDSFLPTKMLLGYLETAMSAVIKPLQTRDTELCVFLMKENPQHKRRKK